MEARISSLAFSDPNHSLFPSKNLGHPLMLQME